MNTTTAKTVNFFYKTLILFLLLLCGSIINRFIENYIDKQASIKEKIDKKSRLDKHYMWKFYFNDNRSNSVTKDTDIFIRQMITEEREQIEKNMLNDGYDRAEIEEISVKAYYELRRNQK